MRSDPGLKVHLTTWQSPYAHSQDNAGVAYGRLYECPRVAQPELGLGTNQTSLEKPINGCPPMVPSQPDRAWDDLKRRMAKKKQMQMCKACCIIPKKTWGCNCCQSALCFELRVWRLVQCHFFSVSFLINLQSCDKSVFCFVIMVSGV